MPSYELDFMKYVQCIVDETWTVTRRTGASSAVPD